MQTEPSRIIGTITAGVTAVIALLVAFGLDISQEQQAAILGVVAVAAPLVAAVVIRRAVWAPDSVREVAQEAARTGAVPDRALPPA